jgi:hypothetical protein
MYNQHPAAEGDVSFETVSSNGTMCNKENQNLQNTNQEEH